VRFVKVFASKHQNLHKYTYKYECIIVSDKDSDRYFRSARMDECVPSLLDDRREADSFRQGLKSGIFMKELKDGFGLHKGQAG
jgi:hypothetical protein